MICYRDMTFCAAKDCAKFANCERAYTETVQKLAVKSGLDVCLVLRLDCFEQSTKEGTNNELETEAQG